MDAAYARKENARTAVNFCALLLTLWILARIFVVSQPITHFYYWHFCRLAWRIGGITQIFSLSLNAKEHFSRAAGRLKASSPSQLRHVKGSEDGRHASMPALRSTLSRTTSSWRHFYGALPVLRRVYSTSITKTRDKLAYICRLKERAILYGRIVAECLIFLCHLPQPSTCSGADGRYSFCISFIRLAFRGSIDIIFAGLYSGFISNTMINTYAVIPVFFLAFFYQHDNPYV